MTSLRAQGKKVKWAQVISIDAALLPFVTGTLRVYVGLTAKSQLLLSPKLPKSSQIRCWGICAISRELSCPFARERVRPALARWRGQAGMS